VGQVQQQESGKRHSDQGALRWALVLRCCLGWGGALYFCGCVGAVGEAVLDPASGHAPPNDTAFGGALGDGGSAGGSGGSGGSIDQPGSGGAAGASGTGGSTALGRFAVVAGQIIDPEGRPFIARGTNANGYNWVWPRDTVDDALLIIDCWGFNLVRINNIAGDTPEAGAAEIEAIVQTFTARKIVVELDEHTLIGGSYTASRLAAVKAFFTVLAERYQDNPYVWFNIANEPGDTGSGDQDTWQAQAQALIEAIRATGAPNIIVVPGTSWGQDTGPSWKSDLIDTDRSFILSRGPLLAAAYQDLVFEFHAYDQWNYGSARLADFLDQAAAKQLAVIIGEFGVANGNATTNAAVEALYDVAPSRGVGRVVWAWFGGDDNELTTSGNGGGFNVDDCTHPTNLSWLGAKVWADTHSP
jgi:mannan endo-1,4-beta-mannosidase